MKISDYLHTLYRDRKSYPDIFRVRVFANNAYSYCVLTDLNDMRTGNSITQYIEFAYQDLVSKGLILPECIVIEHYEGETRGRNSFSQVAFDSSFKPSWTSKSLEQMCYLVGCSEDEFLIESLEITWIYKEVSKFRHQLSPFLDLPFEDSHDVIVRRDTINKNKIPRDELISFIQRNPTESEIHRLLNSDLSILGDYFSSPNESYIVFSEFQLKYKSYNGFVDFVVFTSSSRMEVILIEIKGANYNLITQGNYTNFSSKTNEAVQQLRNRTFCLHENISYFKKHFHKVRKKAEAGKYICHTLVGPLGKLQVDPRKEIIIKRVCIGGRSIDDVKESRLRHEYEYGQSPTILIESWDSFLTKLHRR